MSRVPSHPVNLRWLPRFPFSLVRLRQPHHALPLHALSHHLRAQLPRASPCLNRCICASQSLGFPALPSLPPVLLQYQFQQWLPISTLPWPAFPSFLPQRHPRTARRSLPRILSLRLRLPPGRERAIRPLVVRRRERRRLHLPPTH
jgi:hypothetical protein